jgi:hypothetical protein
MRRGKGCSMTLKGGIVFSEKKEENMIEVLKMLKCRVRVYIDELFQLMPNLGFCCLYLKCWNSR